MKIRYWISALFTALAALTLAGCASPQYVTHTSYIPPADSGGLACVESCHSRLQTCQADCKARRDACVSRIEPKVMATFQDELRRYEIQRRQYEADRRAWELDRQFDWTVGYGWGWPYHHPYYSSFWLTDRPYYWRDLPKPPPAPSLKATRARVIHQECDVACGCQQQFDQCYVGCGGTVKRTTVCVKNCGPNDIKAPPANGQAKPVQSP